MGVFNKTIIPLTLVGYEMVECHASYATYHLISHTVVAPPVYSFSNLPSKHYSDGNLSITSKARGSGVRG